MRILLQLSSSNQYSRNSILKNNKTIFYLQENLIKEYKHRPLNMILITKTKIIIISFITGKQGCSDRESKKLCGEFGYSISRNISKNGNKHRNSISTSHYCIDPVKVTLFLFFNITF